VIYCINPYCENRENSEEEDDCQGCGTSLVIDNRFHLLRPVRHLSDRRATDVYEAEDEKGVIRIMKVLRRDDPKLVVLFKREASILSTLSRSKDLGVPKVGRKPYFVVRPNNSPHDLHCLVMEKIEGQNLEQWLHEHGAIAEQQVYDWLKQLIEILECVHGEGYFHRDIKPSNIMLKPDGKLVLIDFGTCRDSTSLTYLSKISSKENITGQEEPNDITAVVSFGYTAPEQFNAKAVPQSDFYALGKTIIHILSGVHPASFPQDDDTGQVYWRDRASNIDPRFADLLDRMIAPNPNERPTNTRALMHELKRSKPIPRPVRRFLKSPYAWITGALGAGLLIWGAREAYKALKPVVSNVYAGMAEEGIRLGDLDGAREDYQNAIRWNPRNGKLYYKLGFLCKAEKDYGCALKSFDNVLKFQSGDWVYLYNVGQVYDEQGQYEKAEQSYLKSIAQAGINGGRPMNNLARLKNIQIKSGEAISLAEKGLKTQGLMNDTRGALYKNLGWAYLNKGDADKALSLFNQSVVISSKRADTYCLIALAKEKKNSSVIPGDDLDKCFHFESDLPEVRKWQDKLIDGFLDKKKTFRQNLKQK
jgi:Tfp pilus assembly protein PilF/thiamine kinase-like enzyme